LVKVETEQAAVNASGYSMHRKRLMMRGRAFAFSPFWFRFSSTSSMPLFEAAKLR
jgi:hypothetical protein